MAYDINAAIETYSHSMGNRIEELAEYCAEHGVAEREAEIMAAIDELQTLAVEHCGTHAPEVDEAGARALLRWIVWMAWHEGCMK